MIQQYFGNARDDLLGQDLVRSSPLTAEGDDDINMTLYIEWLSPKHPTQTLELSLCGAAMKEHGWGFSDIKQITREDWKDMHISLGYARKLEKHCKQWAKLRKWCCSCTMR